MGGVLLAGLLALTSSHAAPQAADPTPRQRYEALVQEYQGSSEVWSKIYDEARARAEPVKRYEDWPAWSFSPRFIQLAQEHPDDPAAIDALLWVVNLDHAVNENDRALLPFYALALEILARDHLDDERVWRLCLENVAKDLSVPAEQFLRTAVALAPAREARGYACLGLATYLVAKRDVALDPWFEKPAKNAFGTFMISRLDPGFIQYVHAADATALREEASRLFERTIAEFADIKSRRLGVSLAELARPFLRELRELSLGRLAPEIAGTDADSKPFKLTDYRGKVVVLTFSGNWSAPCRAVYPEERELVKRLKDQPFALLSVNTDADRSTLQKSINDGEITWRTWWDGANGAIREQWNVKSFPTVYVLDRAGVIRFKGSHGPGLDEAVNNLLKEPEASSRPTR